MFLDSKSNMNNWREMAALLPTFRLLASELPYRAAVIGSGPPKCQTFWWGQAYVVGIISPPHRNMVVTNLTKYGEDQSSYVPAALLQKRPRRVAAKRSCLS